jgi:hypothetical protein
VHGRYGRRAYWNLYCRRDWRISRVSEPLTYGEALKFDAVYTYLPTGSAYLAEVHFVYAVYNVFHFD